MKKVVALLLVVCLLCGLVGCRKGITIPDVSQTDESTCKTLLAGKGLIPKVEYQYDDKVEKGLVIDTMPTIGSKVYEDDIVTVIVSKGKRRYDLADALGAMYNVTGIQNFSWGDDGQKQTKGFYGPYVEEEYLYIEMFLCCKSYSQIEFYDDFGSASITDTFDKTVPIKVIYSSKKVDNNGGKTSFKVKIPLSDLGVQKPTNLYIEFDFLVAGKRQTFKAEFDLTW